jgi:hypothetical protein
MKIVSFIDEASVIRKFLKHCGLWKGDCASPVAHCTSAWARRSGLRITIKKGRC